MISGRHLEGIARDVHEQTGVVAPVDALELAQLCGFELRPWGRAHGALVGETIRYPIKARETRQHGIVAHELAHWRLRSVGEDDADEDAARYLGGALLVPREALLADVRSLDLDLFALQSRHPNASAELVAARLTQVMPATASVWDHGKHARSYGGADHEAARTLVDRVLTTERPERDGDLRAWPVFDGHWRRVIVLAA